MWEVARKCWKSDTQQLIPWQLGDNCGYQPTEQPPHYHLFFLFKSVFYGIIFFSQI